MSDPSFFDAPNRRSDVILKIGEKKVHVAKEILAAHSPMFEILFFGSFAENGKEEVEIKDVVYEEFLDLLYLIYFGTMEITDRTLPHILKLSDQFQIERILSQSKKHLTQTRGIDAMKKRQLADQYGLNSEKDKRQSSKADNSKFVLHWAIDNAAAAFQSGKAESGVFNEGGFKWTAAFNRRVATSEDPIRNSPWEPRPDLAAFTLRCDANCSGKWKCEVELDVCMEGSYDIFLKRRFCFNEKNNIWSIPRRAAWEWDQLGYSASLHPDWINDKFILDYRINVIKSEMGKPVADHSCFDVPNGRSDVILKIEQKKVHVSKELLAVHSPAFETLFFGGSVENRKEEVEINDVVYHEFLDLLHLIYMRTMKITDRTVSHILKLSDLFQMERILDHSKKYLCQTKGIDKLQKLVLADKYGIDYIKDQCLRSFTRVTAGKLKTSPEFDSLSDGTKAAIRNRFEQEWK